VQEFKKMVIGRAKERAFLIDDRHLEPTAVNVVMGPPDCGKSTLFKDMYGYGDYPSIYIDIGTPEVGAKHRCCLAGLCGMHEVQSV
jgi:ABC-type cobalamin/Fe3+-siderophores transport system ATPase subunit